VSYPGPPLRGPSIVELPLLFYRFVIQVVETYLSTSSHTPYPSFDTVVGQACLGFSQGTSVLRKEKPELRLRQVPR
jgi:hypothetical protein